MTPEETIAAHFRDSIENRIAGWKAEREQLLKATERLAELNALIAFAEDATRTQFRVAPRPLLPLPDILPRTRE